MLSLPASIRIFLATEPVDFCKSHDGLVAVVRDHLRGDPFDGSVFAFLNRRRDRVKLLLWDHNGFWLLYKRLERGTFRAVERGTGRRVELRRGEFAMLLEGIDLKAGKCRRFFAEGIRVGRRPGDDAPASARDTQ